MCESQYLATYGTLMRAVGGVDRLGLKDRVSVVDTCQFAGLLYDLGRFPGAVPGDGVVHGEILRLRDPQVWSVLDRYEGCDPHDENDSLFVREKVTLLEPAEQTAWVYWYNGDPAGHRRVHSGDWAAYIQTDDET